jgi:Zn-dependent protease with chaperone function
VTVATCLLLYSLTVILVGPTLLGQLTESGDAPRFGVAAWLTAIGGVLLSWLAAAALTVVEVVRHWSYPTILLSSCLARLRGVVAGHAGFLPQFVLLVIAAVVALAAVVTSVRVARMTVNMRARAREHACAVRLVGRPTADADVVVLDAAKPAAYCVSGRPPAIVVTSAALAALDEQQLAAVLAHERAHLTGHHSVAVTVLRGIAAVFPRLSLMTQGAQQVSRLLEMCADDIAARGHGRQTLLSGLMALCRAEPAEALAAADVAALARAERLAVPPEDPVGARARAALASVVAFMTAGPLIMTALAASGALVCGAR